MIGPTVSRLVHYTDRGNPGVCHAALVTQEAVVHGGGGGETTGVSLAVFLPRGGIMFENDVHYDEDREFPRGWHWPERTG